MSSIKLHRSDRAMSQTVRSARATDDSENDKKHKHIVILELQQRGFHRNSNNNTSSNNNIIIIISSSSNSRTITTTTTTTTTTNNNNTTTNNKNANSNVSSNRGLRDVPSAASRRGRQPVAWPELSIFCVYTSRFVRVILAQGPC